MVYAYFKIFTICVHEMFFVRTDGDDNDTKQILMQMLKYTFTKYYFIRFTGILCALQRVEAMRLDN